MFKNYYCKDGLTIKKFKEILKDLPEKDKYGNDCKIDFNEQRSKKVMMRHSFVSVVTAYDIPFGSKEDFSEKNFSNVNLRISDKGLASIKRRNTIKYLFLKLEWAWKKFWTK